MPGTSVRNIVRGDNLVHSCWNAFPNLAIQLPVEPWAVIRLDKKTRFD
jgi:hypothetical protein